MAGTRITDMTNVEGNVLPLDATLPFVSASSGPTINYRVTFLEAIHFARPKMDLFGGAADAVVGPTPFVTTLSGTDNLQPLLDTLDSNTYEHGIGYIYSDKVTDGLGKRRFSGAFEAKRIVNIEGQGSGFDGSGSAATSWFFPADSHGIVTNSLDTFEGQLTANTTSSFGSSFYGIRLASAGGTDQTRHGFRARVKFVARSMVLDGFPGDGFNVVAQAGGGAETRGNNNGFYIERCTVKNAGRHGGYFSLTDSNTGVTIGFQCQSADQCGLVDADTFGNLHLAPEIDAFGQNGQAHCSHNGLNYQLISNTPGIGSATTPGTDDNIWYPTGALASWTAWSALNTYTIGTPIFTTGGSNRGVILCPYTEGGFSHAGGEVIVIGGQAGFTRKSKHLRGVAEAGPALFCSSGIGGHTNLPLGTTIAALGTGAGGTGTYTVSPLHPQGVASTTITGISSTGSQAVFTASIADGTMTVTAVASGTIAVGMRLTGTGVTTGAGSEFGTFMWTAIGNDFARGVILESLQQFAGHKNSIRYMGRSIVVTYDSSNVQSWGWSCRGTTRTFGRVGTGEGIRFDRLFALGNGTGNGGETTTSYRIFHMASAMPSTGDLATGEGRFNLTPATGGNWGWSCAAGHATTGGTWYKAGTLFIDASATYDPGSIASMGVATTTVTATGAVLGDIAQCSFSLALGGLMASAEVSAADTVTVTLFNPTGGAINLGSGTLRVRASKV
jgi:hypothetical protein